ncbi:MAG TPA: alpha/beta fold hydrolase [Thermoanaerobaculia bacterium]|nr:alpha/beta fold hydrolase [Thermoanaerobaculia bacterium]
MRAIATRPSLILLVLFLTAQALSAQVAQLSDADLTTRAERFVDLLAQGGFEEAAKGFDNTMKAAAPPAKLAEIWKALQAQLGPFQKRTATRVEPLGGYRSAFVTSRFEKDAVNLQVVFDGEGRIAGFFVKPAPAAAGAAPAPGTTPALPAYIKKDSFQEKEVEVGAGEWAVPGTLSIPTGKGPFPAVVLVHGSGPNDRDETLGPNKPFRDLAWGLASKGIAVLRYEKRTRFHGDKLASLPKPTVKEETVDDAVAAAQLLRRTEGIDPRRVFVLGHSLGGMLIPRIGARDGEIAGLVILAGLTRPMEETIVQQLSYIASLDGTVTDEEKKRLDEFQEQAAKVKGLTPESTESLMGIPASYWLDLRGYNPPAAAARLRQPLLILQGERDYQVTMDDFQAWKKGLAEKKNVTFKSYPNLNHLFMEGEGKATPSEYERPGHVAAVVIDDIAEWVGKAGTTAK